MWMSMVVIISVGMHRSSRSTIVAIIHRGLIRSIIFIGIFGVIEGPVHKWINLFLGHLSVIGVDVLSIVVVEVSIWTVLMVVLVLHGIVICELSKKKWISQEMQLVIFRILHLILVLLGVSWWKEIIISNHVLLVTVIGWLNLSLVAIILSFTLNSRWHLTTRHNTMVNARGHYRAWYVKYTLYFHWAAISTWPILIQIELQFLVVVIQLIVVA